MESEMEEEQQGDSLQHKIDAALKKSIRLVSAQRRYQNWLVLLMMVLFFTSSYLYASEFIVYRNPIFSCQFSKGRVLQNDACSNISQCSIEDDFTLTSRLGLYCKGKDNRTLIQTASSVGAWISTGICFLLGSILSKKYMLIGSSFTLFLSIAFQIIGGLQYNLGLVIASGFLMGFSERLIKFTSVILIIRFLSKEQSQQDSIYIFLIGQGGSQLALALINSFMPIWTFNLYLIAPFILIGLIASFFLVKEDPNFLYQNGKIDECKAVVSEIGAINQCTQADFTEAMVVIDSIEKISKANPEMDLNMSNNYFLPIVTAIVLGICGSTFHLCSRSLKYNIEKYGISQEFNLYMLAAAKILGFYSTTFLMHMESNRVRGYLVSLFSYCMFAMLYLLPFFRNSNLLESIAFFFLMFFEGWIQMFLTRIKLDSFKKSQQANFVGFIELIENCGRMLAPWLIQISVDNDLNPIMLTALIMMIFGTIPIIALRRVTYQQPKQDETDAKTGQHH